MMNFILNMMLQGVTKSLSATLIAVNIPDGAHHSDLSHTMPCVHYTRNSRLPLLAVILSGRFLTEIRACVRVRACVAGARRTLRM